jgi:outer membrane protein TolC
VRRAAPRCAQVTAGPRRGSCGDCAVRRLRRWTQFHPAAYAHDRQLDTVQAEPAQWWSPLDSAQLDQLIQQVLKSNHTLQAARATLAQGRALDVVSEAALYPDLTANASAGRNRYGASFLGPTNLPPFTFYSIGVAVSYTFDLNGGIRRAIEQQHAQTLYQLQELNAAELTVSGNVALQAVAAAAARAQIDNLLALLEDDRKDVQLVKDAFEAGSGTRVDVLTAQSQLANDQTLLPPLRRDLSNATHALALLAGEAPSEWSPPEFRLDEFTVPARLPVSLPSELAHRRPDILAAEAQVQPLFNHGQLRARQRAAIEAMHAAGSNYQQVVLSAFTQVADTLEGLDHDQELIDSEQAAVATASDNLELTRESYSAGNSGVLQVLEAQRQNQQARLGLVRAQSLRLQDMVQLLLALGGQIPSD